MNTAVTKLDSLTIDGQCAAGQLANRQIRFAFWCAAILFGALDAWNNRHMMNSDGISYLDLSDAYLQTGWKGLVNAYWSPFYPWLIAISRLVLRPSGYWEFATVHLVNFLCFLGAAGAFEFLLSEIAKLAQSSESSGDTKTQVLIPSWAFRAIAYTTFLWLSLTLITLERESPDMLMSIFLYLGVGLVLRVRRNGGTWGSFAMLGVVLGLGYLAKAPMFPLACVFLAIALFASGNAARALPRILLSLILFAFISAPLVVGISRAKGRLSFGDSGRWNYLTEIDGAGPVWYMLDVGSARGRFIHPSQRIYDSPPVYAFDGPMAGTLPIWYDPSYWIEGAQPRFVLHRQVVRLFKNAGVYFDLIFTHEVVLVAVFVVLFWLGAPGGGGRLLRAWPAWIPPLAALGMYLVVLVDPRYVAGFLIVLWVTLFSSIRLRPEATARRIAGGAAIAVVFALGTPMLLSSTQSFHTGVLHEQRHTQWDIARQLKQMGVKPGDRVGRIGGLHRVEWARLLHVRVIAEIPRDQAEVFWSSSPAIQAQVIESFSRVGVTAIVAEQIQPAEVFSPSQAWQRIGNGDFYVYLIRKSG